MSKKNQKASLYEFYLDNQEKYNDLAILETINQLIDDFKASHPEMFEPIKNIIVAVKSIGEALNNIDYNWENKYKNHPFLSFYQNGEAINNVIDFYKVNKEYYDSLKIKHGEIVNSLLNTWQGFSGETVQNTGHFYNKAFNLDRRIIYIKSDDLKDYLDESKEFKNKVFGDSNVNIFLNFLYKKGDRDFEFNNLGSSILKSKKQQLLNMGVCQQSEELYKLIKNVKIFSFKAGKDFRRELLKDNHDFPRDGIYLMFEDGEVCNNQQRIVRVGINKSSPLIDRLNKHINGTKRVSIFRKHLWRILCKDNNEGKVTDHIKNRIKFCIISGPEDKGKRERLESKIIGTISNCIDCHPSANWLGLKSESSRIKKSGLWNVQHVFSDNKLDDEDLNYINAHFYGKQIA
jgi:hypothetical protein